nr:MerR family transcriptional regulator [Chloroflexota bacterium]
MNEFHQEWTERQICEAFKLSRSELQRLVMEKVIPQPQRTYTGQRVYTEQHVDCLRRYIHLQNWQKRLQAIREHWELDPNDTGLQSCLCQLLSLRRLFGENNLQGLDELRQYESLEPETLRLIMIEMQWLSIESDLFVQIVSLLYEKVVCTRQKRSENSPYD